MFGQLSGLQSLNELLPKDKPATGSHKRRKSNTPPKPIRQGSNKGVVSPSPSNTLHSYFTVVPKETKDAHNGEPAIIGKASNLELEKGTQFLLGTNLTTENGENGKTMVVIDLDSDDETPWTRRTSHAPAGPSSHYICIDVEDDVPAPVEYKMEDTDAEDKAAELSEAAVSLNNAEAELLSEAIPENAYTGGDRYYINNFYLILNTVYMRDSHLFSEDENLLFARFKTLPITCQRLLVRLYYRKV